MIFYCSLVLLPIVIGMYAHQKRIKIPCQDREPFPKANHKYLSIIIFFSILFVFLVGCRADSVGIDTLNYKITYMQMANKSFSYLSKMQWFEEPGYRLLLIFLNKLGFSWTLYFVVAAAIYTIPIMILIYKESENVFFSIALFLLLGYFTFPMSTMRQSMAIGLCLIAYLQYQKGRIFLSFLFLIIAASVHVSALIFLLYFGLLMIPLNRNNINIWVSCALLFIILGVSPLRDLFIYFLNLIGKDYSGVETGGLFRELFFIITIFVSLYVNRFNKDFLSKHKNSFKAVLLAAVLLPIVRYHPALTRIYFYFSVFEIILIPSMLVSIRDLKTRLTGTVCYFVGALYMMLLQLPAKNVIPYLFFWSLK